MGIAYEQVPEFERERVGEAVCGDVVRGIDEVDVVQSSKNWRVATILTAATCFRHGGDTSDPVTRSGAERVGSHQASGVAG
jgi:hypothetical protein